MMKKFRSGAALLLAVVMLLGILSGCGDKTPDTPDVSNNLIGCTVEVKSEGGKALAGVGMYIYKDATLTDMIDYVKTNDQGVATVTNAVPVGGVAVLDKVPAGYVVEENYAITTTETKIALQTQLRQEIGKIALGDVMFDFTVTDITGATHTLSQLLQSKKAVVLNLWYVNCEPCKMEFPYLVEAYGNYKDEIEVLAINPEGDGAEDIAAFVAEHGLTFPTAKGDEVWKGTVANLMYPATIIIDRFGTVGLIHIGGIDSAKTFEDAFAYFTAENYVQSTVAKITDVAAEEEPEDPTEPTNPEESTNATDTVAPTDFAVNTDPTQAPTQAPTNGPTNAPTQAPTKAPTQVPTQAPTNVPTNAPTQAPTQKPTQAPTQATEPAGPNTNGTLVNPDEPVEQYGFNDFSVEVGAGEKMLVSMIRTMNAATFCIEDKDAYVIYKGKTYTPSNGAIYIEMKSDGSFTPLELEIGNSGSTKKTFDVVFYFAEGTRENPGQLKTGNNTISCASGNDQGTFYTFEAAKAGTLTLKIKSIDPDTVVLGINVSDMQEIPTVVELEEGSDTVSIDLPAGAVAEIIFSTKDPNKEWKIPAAEVVISVTFA